MLIRLRTAAQERLQKKHCLLKSATGHRSRKQAESQLSQKGLKLGSKISLVHIKFSMYYDFYVMTNSETAVQILGWQHNFNFGVFENTKNILERYVQFLQGGIVQESSLCEGYINRKRSPCILLIDKGFKGRKNFKYSAFIIKEEYEFQQKVAQIKNTTGMHEHFHLGLYQDSKLSLGNLDQIDDLNPEDGQIMELTWKARSWISQVIGVIL